MNKLRPDLPPLPERVARLPIDERGFPVPWFVAWVDGNGDITEAESPGAIPELRCMDGDKLRRAIKERLCWVCGQKLGVMVSFVLGPMCTVTRTSAEPPCHKECAVFSAKACPFLTQKELRRRENDLPSGTRDAPGMMIRRQPGAIAIWTCQRYETFGDGRGGTLIKIGVPPEIEWWSHGRAATRDEVQRSIDTGLPILMEQAKKDGPSAVRALNEMAKVAMGRLPVA
jgi:hypothetical protein